MKTVKTSEMTGNVLNWVIAKCEGFTSEYEADKNDFWIERTNHTYTGLAPFGYLKEALRFSTDWSQGGPIIERETIAVVPLLEGWEAQFEPSDQRFSEYHLCLQRGPTPLIAAMRCYVASKLGETVEVPEELTQ